jgi:hypothetical protein
MGVDGWGRNVNGNKKAQHRLEYQSNFINVVHGERQSALNKGKDPCLSPWYGTLPHAKNEVTCTSNTMHADPSSGGTRIRSTKLALVRLKM